MDDRHHVPLETIEGSRTAASGGERILIGLALLALFGGVLIAFSNLLGVNLQASATDSPRPTAEASDTPRPTRSPKPRQQFVVEPGPAPSGDVSWYGSASIWMRATTELQVRSGPSLDSPVRATLAAGEALSGTSDESAVGPSDGNGWVLLDSPHGGLYTATRADGRDLVQRYPSEVTTYSAWVRSLVAGPNGFVAIGQRPGRSDQSNPTESLLASDTGRVWVEADDSIAAYGQVQSVAWGPMGWLAATVRDQPGATYAALIRSSDGRSWEALGSLPDRFSGWNLQIIASDFGYLLVQPYGYGNSWFSEEGTAWREMEPLPAGFTHEVVVKGIDDGFLAWDIVAGEGERPAAAAFSVNGRGWTEVIGGPLPRLLYGEAPMVVQLEDRLIGFDDDPDSGAAHAWLGTINQGELSWRRVPGTAATFRDATLTALLSDGSQAWVLGARRGSGQPLAWVGDGATWAPTPLPEEIGISLVAAGPRGVVAVGLRPTLRAENPIFWHWSAGRSWEPEPDPIFPVVPDRPDDCGTLPADLLELQARSTPSLLTCFGSSPITVRGWVAPCDWCPAEPDPGAEQYDPAWLAAPREPLLLGARVSRDYTVLSAVFPPSLLANGNPSAWAESWVEVTVHLDDPAAGNCSFTPAESDGFWYPGNWPGNWLVNQCRQTWVVEAIRSVDGP